MLLTLHILFSPDLMDELFLLLLGQHFHFVLNPILSSTENTIPAILPSLLHQQYFSLLDHSH